MEEHINATESHYSDKCPGPDKCSCAAGLRRVLEGLEAGTLTIRREVAPDEGSR